VQPVSPSALSDTGLNRRIPQSGSRMAHRVCRAEADGLTRRDYLLGKFRTLFVGKTNPINKIFIFLVNHGGGVTALT
jgi:hypothetical protein